MVILSLDDEFEGYPKPNPLPNFKPYLKYRAQPQGTNFKNYLSGQNNIDCYKNLQ